MIESKYPTSWRFARTCLQRRSCAGSSVSVEKSAIRTWLGKIICDATVRSVLQYAHVEEANGAEQKDPKVLKQAYHTMVVRFACTRVGSWMVLRLFSPIDKCLMRWSNGVLHSGIGTNINVALLRCTGAKSGKPRTIPLHATPLGEQFVLIASATGQEKNPAWYYNLKVNPECSLLVRPQGEIDCVAHEAEGEERKRAWAAANALYSGFTIYQERTKRRVPVMILTPRFTE